MKTAKITVVEGKEAGMRNRTGWNSPVSSHTKEPGENTGRKSTGKSTGRIQANYVRSVDLVLVSPPPRPDLQLWMLQLKDQCVKCKQ